MSAADHLSEQLGLWEKGPYLPSAWTGPQKSNTEAGELWHSSWDERLPPERGRYDNADQRDVAGMSPSNLTYQHPVGMHAGTGWAAVSVEGGMRDFYHPLSLHGPVSDRIYHDTSANNSERATAEVEAGITVPYKNVAEDIGSISYRAPRQNLRTWRESILADPTTASVAEIRAANAGWDLHYVPDDSEHAEYSTDSIGKKSVKTVVSGPYSLQARALWVEPSTEESMEHAKSGFAYSEDDDPGVRLIPRFVQAPVEKRSRRPVRGQTRLPGI